MVKGLEIFRNHFADFSGSYVLIGGTACDLAFAAVQIKQPTRRKSLWLSNSRPNC